MYYFFIINIIITIIITIIILYTYVYSEINLYSFLVSEYFGLAEIRQTSTPHGPSRQALEAWNHADVDDTWWIVGEWLVQCGAP